MDLDYVPESKLWAYQAIWFNAWNFDEKSTKFHHGQMWNLLGAVPRILLQWWAEDNGLSCPSCRWWVHRWLKLKLMKRPMVVKSIYFSIKKFSSGLGLCPLCQKVIPMCRPTCFLTNAIKICPRNVISHFDMHKNWKTNCTALDAVNCFFPYKKIRIRSLHAKKIRDRLIRSVLVWLELSSSVLPWNLFVSKIHLFLPQILIFR